MQTILRCTWRLRSGRKITVFGTEITVAPETVFPSYRRLRLPRGGPKSEIVRYGDYVQIHSALAHINSLGRAATVMDVGAHHGAYAIVLGKTVQKLGGRVIAVEPNPLCFDILKQNVRRNNLTDVVFCERCAVLDKQGKVSISLQGSESHVSGALVSDFDTVEAVTLETLIRKHQIAAVDLLIVDVEGAELPVLRGFPWGDVEIGKIFCELHPYAWSRFGYRGHDLQTFLEEQDLRCIDMYLMEYSSFSNSEYVGPALLFPRGSAKEHR